MQEFEKWWLTQKSHKDGVGPSHEEFISHIHPRVPRDVWRAALEWAKDIGGIYEAIEKELES